MTPLYRIQRAIYEHPTIVALGPLWSAIFAGFVVVIFGEPFLTPAGELYLEK
jgi:hypothetical protein